MSDKQWYVPGYRNAWFGLLYRAQRVKWADFAGVCMSLDHRVFWTRKAAQERADEMNRRADEAAAINARAAKGNV